MKSKALLPPLVAIFVLANFDIVAKTYESKKGNATYYGNQWHGRTTSSGVKYHKDSLTCAHRTLPFGTILRVTNQRNGKEVVVKVTDRGPFRPGAIIDLSMAAAKQIDMVRDGICPVEIAEIGKVKTDNSKDNPVLPELELLDPVTGNYYTMTEWQKRSHDRETAQKNGITKPLTAKAQPRYRVINGQNTAKNVKK